MINNKYQVGSTTHLTPVPPTNSTVEVGVGVLDLLSRKIEWVVEPDKFKIKVGTSSALAGFMLKGDFTIC